MGFSKNSGIPKSSILIGFSIINHPFWGTPILGNTHMYLDGWLIIMVNNVGKNQSSHCSYGVHKFMIWAHVFLVFYIWFKKKTSPESFPSQGWHFLHKVGMSFTRLVANLLCIVCVMFNAPRLKKICACQIGVKDTPKKHANYEKQFKKQVPLAFFSKNPWPQHIIVHCQSLATGT